MLLIFILLFGFQCFTLESEVREIILPTRRFEPQIAQICDPKNSKDQFYNQYMTESGKWISYFDKQLKCSKNKVDILKFCQKVYPDKIISNIVESNKPQKVSNWCYTNQKGCSGTSRWVKPYRCIVAPFQSDALLVPENCQFLHMHNETVCHEYQRWNGTASEACSKHKMILKSFAMLLPCGIDVFRGVEFVCCPEKAQKIQKSNSDTKNIISDDYSYDDDDDDYEDDEDDDDDFPSNAEDKSDYDNFEDNDDDNIENESDVLSKAENNSKITSETHVITDPYFQQYDPKKEHDSFKAAEKRLSQHQRERITKVMKEWSELEERYQELLETDPHEAENLKKKMTQQFEKKIEGLEEEGEAEKRQLQSVHQQRVLSNINRMKKDAMICYTTALNKESRNTHRIQKCLQQLLRALHKDRHHTLSHFKHLLISDFPQADRQRDLTAEHLTDIDRMINQSLSMLDRHPRLAYKLIPAMKKFVRDLRLQDSIPSQYINVGRESAYSIINALHREYALKYQARLQDKARRENKKRQKTTTTLATTVAEIVSSSRVNVSTSAFLVSAINSSTNSQTSSNETSRIADPQPVPMEQYDIPVANVQSHPLVHNQQGPLYLDSGHLFGRYPLISRSSHENRPLVFSLAFVGIAMFAMIVIGVIMVRKRNIHSPYRQGFVEVNQVASPEERHVSQMQINGYENPTYKYFEAHDA